MTYESSVAGAALVLLSSMAGLYASIHWRRNHPRAPKDAASSVGMIAASFTMAILFFAVLGLSWLPVFRDLPVAAGATLAGVVLLSHGPMLWDRFMN